MREQFLRRAQSAIQDPDLQRALDQNAERRGLARRTAFTSLSDPQAIRSKAQEIRSRAIKHLPDLLQMFTQRLESNGWQVHPAATAAQACHKILRIVNEHGGKLVVKSKSMVTEEIELNRSLLEEGITPVETDLGEFIVQLRNEPPGHIITPAIHLLREDVADTFVQHLGIDFTNDVSKLNNAARHTLRKMFLRAGIGISGVNFGVADTGAICLVTNEGNGRMVTALPEVHIAVMGIERLVPSLEDLVPMLQLLPRAATGQVLSSYVSWIRSPRRAKDRDGPASRHIILVDNGRSALSHSRMQPALLCIRCGACLNACPVYREVGGHSYASVYPGPIGSVVSPALLGLEKFGHLSKASTLCGACREACPVDIDLPTLLLRTRDEYIQNVRQPPLPALGIKFFSWLNLSPRRFKIGMKVAAALTRRLPGSEGWLTKLPTPLKRWTTWRDFPRFNSRPFRDRFQNTLDRDETNLDHSLNNPTEEKPAETVQSDAPVTDRFRDQLTNVDGEFRICNDSGLAAELSVLLEGKGSQRILMDPLVIERLPPLYTSLTGAGFEIITPKINPAGSDKERLDELKTLDSVAAGVTLGLAALADSGTVIVGQDGKNAALTSLLPQLHIALVPEDRFFTSMAEWIRLEGAQALEDRQSVTLITGPSRTADIEMTLTIGVHGPERLIVIAISGSSEAH